MGGCALKLDDGKSALSYYEKGLAASGSSDELKKEMEYNVIVSYEKMQNWEKAKSKLNEYLENIRMMKQQKKKWISGNKIISYRTR